MFFAKYFNNLTIKKKFIYFSFTVVLFSIFIAIYIFNYSKQANENIEGIRKYQLNLIFFTQDIQSKISNVQSLIVQQSILKANNNKFSFEKSKEELNEISNKLNELEEFANLEHDLELVKIIKTVNLSYLLYSLASTDFFFEDYNKDSPQVFYTLLNEVINNANSMNDELVKLTMYSKKSLDISIDILYENMHNNDMKIRYYGALLLLLILLFLFFFSKELIHQIKLLTEGMKEFKDGNLSFRIDVMYKNDLSILSKSLNKMAHSLESSNNQTKKNHQLLLESSKMVAMGEMIGNIAHQWRQPLSVISTIASGIQVKYDLGISTQDSVVKNMEQIIKNTVYLSETIDIFANFIKDEKEYKVVVLQDEIDTAIAIIKSNLDNNYIKLINNIDYDKQLKMKLISGELPQVIINIINNAKDILIEKDINGSQIILNLELRDEIIFISIEDNAGGIPENIIDKIFDPYFTTKHKSKGTGLGLNMSYKIITQSLNGKLYVENTKLGAKFFIELPFNNTNKEV